ncbi:hypothetical protein [Breoghania sp. L-A4]|uniref:hypothetical protein n=1 Tax=Breoghania sp. L-A4 TaxID=2304600 RepID=UPI000E359C38|nr:hypothetical protein [Breoghania sp. L-A4]AXS41243.1 hypothetical protein D1F64_15935 [Breoghania sp. L-A4]
MTKRQKSTARTRREEAPRGLAQPSAAQRRWLELGTSQPGGKLPLFYHDGREVGRRTIESCIAKGWAEPWFSNPIKPDWVVCKLTRAGYEALDRPPSG